jgi:hypothetical protein
VDALKQQGVQITRGGLYGSVSGSYDGSAKLLKLEKPLEFSTPRLTVMKGDRSLLNDEKIGISVNGALGLGSGSAGPLDLSVKSSFANADLKNVHLAMGAQNVWDQLTRADVEVTASDLPKLSALSNAMKPPATQPTDTPMEVTGGNARIVATLSRDTSRQVTLLDLKELTVNKLAVKNGPNAYAFDASKPISIKLAAEIWAAEKL